MTQKPVFLIPNAGLIGQQLRSTTSAGWPDVDRWGVVPANGRQLLARRSIAHNDDI